MLKWMWASRIVGWVASALFLVACGGATPLSDDPIVSEEDGPSGETGTSSNSGSHPIGNEAQGGASDDNDGAGEATTDGPGPFGSDLPSTTTAGLPGDAGLVSRTLSDAVEQLCRRCDAGSKACVDEYAVVIPDPLGLLCLEQLANHGDTAARTYLSSLNRAANRLSQKWSTASCNVAPSFELPRFNSSATQCFTTNYLCPDRRGTATACDGKIECGSGEDEANCGIVRDVFLCHHVEHTVPWSKVCDGKMDCDFGEDELNCYARAN